MYDWPVVCEDDVPVAFAHEGSVIWKCIHVMMSPWTFEVNLATVDIPIRATSQRTSFLL